MRKFVSPAKDFIGTATTVQVGGDRLYMKSTITTTVAMRTGGQMSIPNTGG